MEKKEFHCRHLPHFQQPGQSYFVTWCTADAVPPIAVKDYTQQLKLISSKIEMLKAKNAEDKSIIDSEIELSKMRKKYVKAMDDLLHLDKKSIINLSHPKNTSDIIDTLLFWEGKRIKNYAFTVMSNHVHWVLKTLEKDEQGDPVFLQDILQSVKRFSANQINKNENRKGTVWHNESFDTIIRDDLHLQNAIHYTLENPVKAGLVKNWWEWEGTRYF